MPLIANNQVVLIGAGHAHLYIAKSADQFRRHAIQVTLVDPGMFWYSGLATGILGGMYDRDDDCLDPQTLIERGGGRFIRDRAVGLNMAERLVHLESGARLNYDAISFNVGSEVAAGRIAELQKDSWTVKPISNLWRLRQHLQRCFAKSTKRQPLRIVVIGGGPTGCEVAANIDALARHNRASIQLTLCSRSERLLQGQPVGASRQLARTLCQRGIDLQLACEIAWTRVGSLMATDGRHFPYDILVIATGLRPQRLVGRLGLATDHEGGLRVNAQLCSLDDERVFGVGDCISLEGYNLPKLGVFGVRAAPVLLHNLLAVLTDTPLKDYRPQKRYLSILNLGGGQGLATWGSLYWQGRLSLWLKDWIDRRFMAKYRFPY